MSLFESHMLRLNEQMQAVATRLSDGRHVVQIPNFPLPQGKWSKPKTSVWFLVPVGYPQAPPDCFFVDRDLVLSSGAPPQSTQFQVLPETGELLWFSWHVSHWHPSRDTLVTWVHMIRHRLERGQ